MRRSRSVEGDHDGPPARLIRNRLGRSPPCSMRTRPAWFRSDRSEPWLLASNAAKNSSARLNASSVSFISSSHRRRFAEEDAGENPLLTPEKPPAPRGLRRGVGPGMAGRLPWGDRSQVFARSARLANQHVRSAHRPFGGAVSAVRGALSWRHRHSTSNAGGTHGRPGGDWTELGQAIPYSRARTKATPYSRGNPRPTLLPKVPSGVRCATGWPRSCRYSMRSAKALQRSSSTRRSRLSTTGSTMRRDTRRSSRCSATILAIDDHSAEPPTRCH